MCDVAVSELGAAQIPTVSSGLPEDVANAQVVLVGEQHIVNPLEAPLMLVESFAKAHPSEACLTFEARPERSTVEALLAGWEGRLASIRSMANPDKQSLDLANVIEDLLGVFPAIYRTAIENKLKVFAIDAPELGLTVDQRSIHMARRIAELLQTRSCTSVLSLVGKTHLTIDTRSAVNMRDTLRASGVRAVSVNMQVTNERRNYPEFRSFDLDCPKRRSLSGFSWVQNDKLKVDPLLYPRRPGSTATYGQFDFTFFIPTHLDLRQEKAKTW